MGITVEQAHEKLVKRYKRQDAWRKGYYPGYQEGTFVYEYGLSDDIFTIESTDTKQDISRKNRLLRDLTKKGGQKLIEIPQANINNRFISERRFKEADKLQSKINYENYKLFRATNEATKDYKYKNKQGVIEHRQVTHTLDTPSLPGLASARGFYIKGQEDLSVGYRVPSAIKRQGEGAIIAYESYLYNRANVPLIEVSSNKILHKYKSLFRGGQYTYEGKDRLKILKQNFMTALFTGKNALLPQAYRNDILVSREFLKNVKNLSGKDILYLMLRYEDIFSFSYVYSHAELQSKIETMNTVIDKYKHDKSRENKGTIEYKSIKSYEKTLGNFYD